MAEVGWGLAFEDPIRLDDGRTLRTLRDAGEYIAALPVTVHDQPEWQVALLLVVSGGPVMFARIGMMRALKRGTEPQGREGSGPSGTG
ncbi:hypothetical protein [Bradyrhizobium sp. KB893862 SZCCT0404]|uniref:hypothetical protein n=1 Tax=Bradyrhizobium sp. KB893862 SZCCT0404 TaxID=2807672 RepID=UPI0020113760|nr:hypothetical protein [Bradyrhizobium sp. KB893862 SZCCT0404]